MRRKNKYMFLGIQPEIKCGNCHLGLLIYKTGSQKFRTGIINHELEAYNACLTIIPMLTLRISWGRRKIIGLVPTGNKRRH